MKEYDNNNRGSLWKSEFVDKNGKYFYSGNITIDNVEHKINMYTNDSDNVKAPCFKLLVVTKKKEEWVGRKETPEINKIDDDVFAKFGNSITSENLLTDEDMNF